MKIWQSSELTNNNFAFVNLHISLSKLVARTKTVEAARADGEKIRLIGAAEARATEAVGRFSHPLSRCWSCSWKLFSGPRQSGWGWRRAPTSSTEMPPFSLLCLRLFLRLRQRSDKHYGGGKCHAMLIPGVCTSCQDRPDCADWRRQQHHTCETLKI